MAVEPAAAAVVHREWGRLGRHQASKNGPIVGAIYRVPQSHASERNNQPRPCGKLVGGTRPYKSRPQRTDEPGPDKPSPDGLQAINVHRLKTDVRMSHTRQADL